LALLTTAPSIKNYDLNQETRRKIMNARNRFKPALALGAVVTSIIALAAILNITVARAQRGDGDRDSA
jgi:hypothetical protein